MAVRADSYIESMKVWEGIMNFYLPNATPAMLMIRDLIAKRQWESVEHNLNELKRYISNLELNEQTNWEMTE